MRGLSQPVRGRWLGAIAVLATLLSAAAGAAPTAQKPASSTPAIGHPSASGRTERTLAFSARSDTVDLAGLEHAFRTLASTASPSVVAITAGDDPAPADAPARSGLLSPAALESLLGRKGRTVGTGFCIEEDGYILTNEHVIAGAEQLYVTTDDGRVFPAMVVGTDPRSDLAVLKVPTSLPPVEFANPETVRRGQWTIALGNPVGLSGAGEMCFSVGVVSALERDLPALSAREKRLYTNLIQTTAEVNPGNSGGPLFDLGGRVIGVVTAVVLPHKSTNGIGFAMPADATMHDKIERLMRGEPVVYGFLGVAGRTVRNGLEVTRIGDETPASGKLLAGDVIIRLNGKQVTDEESFIRLVGATTTEHDVPVVALRNGQEVAVNVRLAARPDTAGVHRPQQRLRWQGLTFAVSTDDDGPAVRVLSVDAGSPLADMLQPGQLLRRVADRPIPDLETLQAVLDATPAEQCQFVVDAQEKPADQLDDTAPMASAP